MSKIKVDEPVKEPTPKTEEQIRAEMPLSYFCQGKGYGLALVQAVAFIFFYPQC